MYRKVKIHFSSILKCGRIIARFIMFWMEGLGELRRRRKCGSQLFLRKARAQDMGQLKFTMHWLMKIHNDFGPHADCIKKGVLPGHVWVL